MAPRPTEVTLVAKIMDPDVSEDAKELARNIIDALDAAREDREWWVVSARTIRNGPTLTIGPYSTKNQALKAAGKIAFADDPTQHAGLGWMVHNMKPPNWLESKQ